MAAIRDVMSTQVITVEPATTVAEAATVMGERRVGSVLVLRDGRLAGIFTERDIVRALGNHFDAASHPVDSWMTADPVTIGPEASVQEGLDRMLKGNFRHLPVIEGGELAGVVSIRDLSQATMDRQD
jgi:CBS domain-containing protein